MAACPGPASPLPSLTFPHAGRGCTPPGTAGRLQEGLANSITKQCWGAPGQLWHPVPWTIPWVRTGEARKNETREEALLMLPLSQGLLSSPQRSRLSQVAGMRVAPSCALAPQGGGRGKAPLLAPQTGQTALSTAEGGQRADRVAPWPGGSAPTGSAGVR